MSAAAVAIVVEDEPQIRRFVRTALESENWRVVEAATLKEGLFGDGNRRPDLVVLDLALPDGDGIELGARCGVVRLAIPGSVGAWRGEGQDPGAGRGPTTT